MARAKDLKNEIREELSKVSRVLRSQKSGPFYEVSQLPTIKTLLERQSRG